MRMPSVLLVDDEHEVRQVLAVVLKRAGYAVLEAIDGESGLRMARDHEPDIVLTDLLMSPMGGLEFIEHLRRDYPDSKIIAMSAYMETLADPIKLGADKALRKPFSIDELRTAVRELMGDHD